MHKQMNEVSVYTTEDGNIVVQSAGGYQEWDTVLITPEQADIVVRWIREAKAELGRKNLR